MRARGVGDDFGGGASGWDSAVLSAVWERRGAHRACGFAWGDGGAGEAVQVRRALTMLWNPECDICFEFVGLAVVNVGFEAPFLNGQIRRYEKRVRKIGDVFYTLKLAIGVDCNSRGK